MAATELVKSIDDMRELLRDIYVNGFKPKSSLSTKGDSMTSKDLGRLKSWLAQYYQSPSNKNGTHKVVIDSRDISHNPLYNAYKAKTFNKPINVGIHFHLLDFLDDCDWHIFDEINDYICTKILGEVSGENNKIESTIRALLKSYEELGILSKEKTAHSYKYKLIKSEIDLESWTDAFAFFSEAAPVGIIGSFLLDKELVDSDDVFRFKHYYLLHALDSHIMYDILDGIQSHKKLTISLINGNSEDVLPIRVFISTQNGSEHLFAYSYSDSNFKTYRINKITDVVAGIRETNYAEYENRYESFKPHMWGVHYGENGKYETVELDIHIDDSEYFILDRLEREKRNGTIAKIDNNLYRYTTTTYDVKEMFPWLRTFIGRIVSFSCTNKKMEELFQDDINKLKEMYS